MLTFEHHVDRRHLGAGSQKVTVDVECATRGVAGYADVMTIKRR